jgi:hypothetical protein
VWLSGDPSRACRGWSIVAAVSRTKIALRKNKVRLAKLDMDKRLDVKNKKKYEKYNEMATTHHMQYEDCMYAAPEIPSL